MVSTNRNNLVLTLFIGNGTTCAICHNLGRYSIGIDNQSKYLDIAIKKLENAKINSKVHYENWLE